MLTWISTGIIYSSRTIYLLSLKLRGQSVLELSVAQDLRDWHDLRPSELNINRDCLLIKNYLPIKFEASEAKHSWVFSFTRLKDTDIQTNRHVQRNSLCESLYCSLDNRSGKFLHLTRSHQVLQDLSVLI